MKERKAKVVAAATVVGLAALGGAALGSNHGLTGPVASAGNGRAPIVTGSSGSTATAQSAAGTAGEGTRAPIVTRASATAGAVPTVDD
jgi:hypothetical protein